MDEHESLIGQIEDIFGCPAASAFVARPQDSLVMHAPRLPTSEPIPTGARSELRFGIANACAPSSTSYPFIRSNFEPGG